MPKNEARSRSRADTVVLVSCVKSKRSATCKAADMYTSPLFRKMMAYARSLNPKSVFILSAKYGLLSPDDVINPYEQTLKTMKIDQRRQWAQRVITDLRKRSNLEEDTFVFLAGNSYRQDLVAHLKYYEIPMEGLAFGAQLQWLTRHVQ
jgi:hypothetical protein